MSDVETEEGSTRADGDADAELTVAASSKAASRALRAGARAPLFTLKDTEGEKVSLEALLHVGPVVLHFSRGPWCSFGEESLEGFAAIYQKIVDTGASAIAIAPPSNSAMQRTESLMRELQDVDMKVSRAFGLAFDLPMGLRARYEALGYVPPQTGHAETWLVPLPATYLLDRDGMVVLAFIDVDYRRHLEPASLLTAVRALQTRRKPDRASRL